MTVPPATAKVPIGTRSGAALNIGGEGRSARALPRVTSARLFR